MSLVSSTTSGKLHVLNLWLWSLPLQVIYLFAAFGTFASGFNNLFFFLPHFTFFFPLELFLFNFTFFIPLYLYLKDLNFHAQTL